jgi:polyhydroxybutyrate depolymerase
MTGRGTWSGTRAAPALVVALGLLVGLVGCSSGPPEALASGGGGPADAAPGVTAPGTAAAPAPVPSPACGAATAGPGVQVEKTLTVEGEPRRYLVTAPTSLTPATPAPVVFDFHGLLEGAEIHATMSQYSKLAEEKGFVVVFPHGTGTPLGWQAGLEKEPNKDLAYFDAVLDQVGREQCVDLARVYSTGLSYGAIFTSLLLCRRADVLAAAAPVAGLTFPDGCTPSRAVPILAYHGTDDPILQFNGGVDLAGIPGFNPDPSAPTTTRPPAQLDGPGYPASVAAWAANHGCDPKPTDTEVSAMVLHRVYRCPAGADVEFYVIRGGGHSWPGSDFSKSIEKIVGPTTFDVDATRTSWEFLSRFTNPAAAGR